jgi:hypothetical protein
VREKIAMKRSYTVLDEHELILTLGIIANIIKRLTNVVSEAGILPPSFHRLVGPTDSLKKEGAENER